MEAISGIKRTGEKLLGVSHERLTIKGATSPACFFACLAAFFSFGVSKARFFASLLGRLDLDMVFTPDNVKGTVGNEAEGRLPARSVPSCTVLIP